MIEIGMADDYGYSVIGAVWLHWPSFPDAQTSSWSLNRVFKARPGQIVSLTRSFRFHRHGAVANLPRPAAMRRHQRADPPS